MTNITTQKPRKPLSKQEKAKLERAKKIPRNHKFLKKIGARMRIIRQVRGLTLAKLSELSHIPEISLLRYEAGRDRDFRIDDLITISDALQINVHSLFA